MKNILDKIIVFFGSESAQLNRVNLFRKSIYIYLLFTVIQQLPVMENLYGKESIIVPYVYEDFSMTSFVNLLSYPFFAEHYYLFFITLTIFCVFGLLNLLPRISSIVIWYCVINMNNRVYLSNTGGDLLVNILLFYLMFISSGEKSKNTISIIRNTLNNTFILACKLQIILLYIVSALYKFIQPEWKNGSALYYILNMNEFTLPIAQQQVVHFPFLSSVFTWTVMIYQSLFPILIFFKNMRKSIVLCGILVHLGIAIVIGLFNFSILMMCCYLLFIDIKRRFPKQEIEEKM